MDAKTPAPAHDHAAGKTSPAQRLRFAAASFALLVLSLAIALWLA